MMKGILFKKENENIPLHSEVEILEPCLYFGNQTVKYNGIIYVIPFDYLIVLD